VTLNFRGEGKSSVGFSARFWKNLYKTYKSNKNKRLQSVKSAALDVQSKPSSDLGHQNDDDQPIASKQFRFCVANVTMFLESYFVV
jgi:hypothetical protein